MTLTSLYARVDVAVHAEGFAVGSSLDAAALHPAVVAADDLGRLGVVATLAGDEPLRI